MRVLSCLLVLGLAAAASAKALNSLEQKDWEDFKAKYNKRYDPIEEAFRSKVFVENSQMISEHNRLYVEGKTTFTMKMNRFGDMLRSEVTAELNGLSSLIRRSGDVATFIIPDSDVVLPDTVDWRQKGAVTAVKDQKKCGSCWAFSATGSLEGQHFLKTGKLVSLSEQNLVDCAYTFGNHGCNGGQMDLAFDYIRSNGGVDTEATYPYTAKFGTCKFNKTDVGADDAGFVDIPLADEIILKAAVAIVGPVSIAIDASKSTFHFYHSGIYSDPTCSSTILDHGVLAVGYGTQDSQDYWLVKNSWNAQWGDEGYIYMARNKDNMCGVASRASYPLV